MRMPLLRMPLFRSPCLTLLTFVAAAALAACGSKSVAKANVPSDPAKHAGGDVASSATASTARANSPKLLTDPDTSRARLNPGRNAHDSVSYQSAIRAGKKAAATWPAGPAPLPGSILPAKRIVAFYGNPLVKKMGILGEYPVDVMLAKLDTAVAIWQKADPSTPVQPALHLIAVVAQGAPGRDGMYRTRMDTALIEKVYGWAQRKNALLFLDIQVGHSTLQQEIPRLLPFLSRPNVHLAVDPEFSMHYEREGLVPSKKVGEMDAADVNYASSVLAKLVSDKHLPPKVLVVHRWTRKMVSHASQIKLDPRVQIVMDMDGWGPPWLKFDSYRDYEVAEPVQFTGFKLFFHHDVSKGDMLLTPREVLRLLPHPMYIQYQ
jgi:hypothetical protein